MWPGFLAAQIVREYSLSLIFLCKIFSEKLDKARGGRRGILDSPFQSTPPRGGRLILIGILISRVQFQSTPPARGATCAVCCLSFAFAISIHAPREGGDVRELLNAVGALAISIHAPREGGDGMYMYEIVGVQDISIHAPREGGDELGRVVDKLTREFQSTPPARGATASLSALYFLQVISIHAPREGGDRLSLPPRLSCNSNFNPRPPRGGRPCPCAMHLRSRYFNPRPPRGGRLKQVDYGVPYTLISIHAPREGGDTRSHAPQPPWSDFNPRPPRGGRPCSCTRPIGSYRISIHAPREGGDVLHHR